VKLCWVRCFDGPENIEISVQMTLFKSIINFDDKKKSYSHLYNELQFTL